MNHERVLVLCILSLLAARVARSDVTCTPVKGNEYCQCKGDGFAINLDHILEFPVDNIPDVSPSEAGQYTYQFSPCKPIVCNGGGESDGVACQFDKSGNPGTYVARNTKGANWTVQSLDPLKFLVLYGGGDKSFVPELERVAYVKFEYVCNTTAVAMYANIPDTQTGTRDYMFQVKGSTVRKEQEKKVICLGFWGIMGLVLMSIALALIASVVTGVIVYYCCSKRRQGWNILQHPISKKNGKENDPPAFSIQ